MSTESTCSRLRLWTRQYPSGAWQRLRTDSARAAAEGMFGVKLSSEPKSKEAAPAEFTPPEYDSEEAPAMLGTQVQAPEDEE